MDSKPCKYYNPHLDTIAKLSACLHELDGCACGGLLHILLDDDNIDDHSIRFCMEECEKNPDREEAKLGKLICEEYLALSMEQRRILLSYDSLLIHKSECPLEPCRIAPNDDICERCFIHNGKEEDRIY